MIDQLCYQSLAESGMSLAPLRRIAFRLPAAAAARFKRVGGGGSGGGGRRAASSSSVVANCDRGRIQIQNE